jgi:hypothetical protein
VPCTPGLETLLLPGNGLAPIRLAAPLRDQPRWRSTSKRRCGHVLGPRRARAGGVASGEVAGPRPWGWGQGYPRRRGAGPRGRALGRRRLQLPRRASLPRTCGAARVGGGSLLPRSRAARCCWAFGNSGR